jgi:hypothetical protein
MNGWAEMPRAPGEAAPLAEKKKVLPLLLLLGLLSLRPRERPK